MKEPLSVYRKANDGSISRRSPIRILTHQMALLTSLKVSSGFRYSMQNNHRRALEQTKLQAARTSYAHDREFADGLIRQNLSGEQCVSSAWSHSAFGLSSLP